MKNWKYNESRPFLGGVGGAKRSACLGIMSSSYEEARVKGACLLKIRNSGPLQPQDVISYANRHGLYAEYIADEGDQCVIALAKTAKKS